MYYKLIKRMIETDNYVSKEDMQKKIDVFWMQGKLTDELYNELTSMLESA